MHKVSVVIPTLDRADLLAQTIERIEQQTVDRKLYEVIVVDNGSKDSTRDVLAQKSFKYSNLRVYEQLKQRGAAATRNVGIRQADGDVVLFIDDDIQAETDLIEQHLWYHQKNPGASIIGVIMTPWDKTTNPFLRYLRDRNIYNPYSIACGPIDFAYYHTGNVSTNRKTLLDVGGFDEEFSVYGMEDIELGYRLQKAGSRMVPGSQARALHQYSPSYAQFIGRCQQAGFSLGKMLELHPELRQRFVENGKWTWLLKRFHYLYRVFSIAVSPVNAMLEEWEEKQGVGDVAFLLDRHYYWAIRYHFFLGYRQYLQSAGVFQRANHGSRLGDVGQERVPGFANRKA